MPPGGAVDSRRFYRPESPRLANLPQPLPADIIFTELNVRAEWPEAGGGDRIGPLLQAGEAGADREKITV